ncbi:MAG TPA: ATP-binding protein, partial [Rhodocyclaceae bacterium]|nr:ATP-binding protein [Rhodocyclaceae bacterium]
LRNLAVVPPNFWTNHASIIGTMLHMLLMSLRLNRRYDVLRREKAEAQAAAVQAIRTLNEGLEREVESRTADLKQEIARRVILETELRAALEVERRIKEEQQDFVAMVSHEFRTPLSIINTTAQQVAKNPDAPWEKTLTRCQNLRDATERMSALVDEYLVVDRMDADASPFRPMACELDALLRDIVGEWPSDRVQLEVKRLPSRYTCDASLLRVALRNLIANAVRHTPSEKRIQVTAECSREQGLSIQVSNPGEAIPLDEIPRLFQKYFRGRLAQHRPGAGLGLYLTERIAQMHGGNVRVENAGADGVVTFNLALPYQADYSLA